MRFDDEFIEIHVHPPGGDEHRAKIRWDEIIRICFKPADFLDSDEVLIFDQRQKNSYLIPIDADGGFALWDEILRRGLFDAELAIRLASLTNGDYHCWPHE
ncbi:MAG: hypothetical protein ACFFAY_06820 [Promethearchaeota archaeon]